jgi:hypothetical protein
MCSQGQNKLKRGTGFIGVLEQLKGLLMSNPTEFDGASVLLTSLPVVVVQSTEDVFVSPRGASVFLSEQLPPERFQVGLDISLGSELGQDLVLVLKLSVKSEVNVFVLR